MHGTGDYTITDLAELFKVSRATVYTHTGRTELAYDTHVAGVVSVRPAPSVALFCTGWTGDPKGRLRGKQPKLKPAQETHLVELWHAEKHTGAELAELFSVARSTVYRALQRAGAPKPVRAARRA